MTPLRSPQHCILLLVTLSFLGFAPSEAQTPVNGKQSGSASNPNLTGSTKTYSPDLVQQGSALFRQDCSFCHGRDAGGGESGPDLTRSKLVAADVDGDKIGPVVRNGRPDKGMPPFDRSDQQIASLVAFIHTQQNLALASASGRRGSGGRKGVDASDLQTGNVEAGKQYFNGAGGCCSLPFADRRSGWTRIALQRPGTRRNRCSIPDTRSRKSQSHSRLVRRSMELWNIWMSLRLGSSIPRAPIDHGGPAMCTFKVDTALDAHVELFSKYTDADVHNLMAYLQTLH